MPRRNSAETVRRTISQKMRIKEGTRTFFVNAPESALKAMELPQLDVDATLGRDFGYIGLNPSDQTTTNGSFSKKV